MENKSSYTEGTTMKYSKYQEAIFNFVKNESGNALINACAGSGKTTTIIESMKFTKGNCIFLAFNKAIATELEKRVPANATAKTLHSLGLSAITKEFGRVQIDALKIDKIMNGLPALAYVKGMSGTEWKDVNFKRSSIKSIISLVKATMTDFTDNTEVAKVCDHYGTEYNSDIMPLFRSIFEKSIAMKNIIDFDDMIYLPVLNHLNTTKYDWVFVDEAQDLNRCQIHLVLSIIKTDGRVIAVGDRNQSIYGFRGADVEAMDRLKNSLNAKELPLSVCYRCPTSHIAKAQTIVPSLEAFENSPVGSIESIANDMFVDNIKPNLNDKPLVLCRTNAPLVNYALQLISNGIKAQIKGADIGKNLINIVKKINGFSIEDIMTGIDKWESDELARLTKRHAAQSAFQITTDKAETLRLIADNSRDSNDMVNNIAKLFADDIVGVVLSSIHKAKGLEAKIVYIARPDLLPLAFKDMQEWEHLQEKNIEYVALTRSKDKLIFINK